MNAPSVDVKDMIEAESSLGLVFNTDLFVGSEPASPDDSTTIFDIPGRPPQLTFTKGEQYFYPSIQIQVRNRDYQVGWDLINDIKIFLHGKAHETWNSTTYSLISCTSEPAMLDWTNEGLVRFVSTFSIQRH